MKLIDKWPKLQWVNILPREKQYRIDDSLCTCMRSYAIMHIIQHTSSYFTKLQSLGEPDRLTVIEGSWLPTAL